MGTLDVKGQKLNLQSLGQNGSPFLLPTPGKSAVRSVWRRPIRNRWRHAFQTEKAKRADVRNVSLRQIGNSYFMSQNRS